VDTGGRQRVCGKYFQILELIQLIEEVEKHSERSNNSSNKLKGCFLEVWSIDTTCPYCLGEYICLIREINVALIHELVVKGGDR
jgi:hypothetical protein